MDPIQEKLRSTPDHVLEEASHVADGELSPEFQRDVLQPLFVEACREYDAGETEECDNPWS